MSSTPITWPYGHTAVTRATATVLFTDLVGSTELRGRLGEEAADEVRRTHDHLLAQAVESNGGRVVKGLGDGIMATFTGAADAVTAAVAIQQAVDRLNRSGKATVPLAVRVGLSAGDVSTEDDDVHGTPVIEAARLCAASRGGEILVSEVVRLLAGLADDAARDRGPLDLKGLSKPVAAWQVSWEAATKSTIPMPPLLTDVGRTFVGRDAELERLEQLWKEAAAGERRVALLAGEPGVGKTRLAMEVAHRAHDEGGIVLAGRCDEDLGVPYQPFVEALRQFVNHIPSAGLRGRLGRYGGELARLLPELSERATDLPPPLRSDPETERYRLFDAVAAWLSAVSAEQPLLLVLDDLQWAAKPTLLLLRYVLRCEETQHLLVVATYRDDELRHDHPLVDILADLRRQDGVARFSLRGLDSGAVTTLIRKAAGHDLDAEDGALARAICAETEGNPFFVREILRHLSETGALRPGDGRSAGTFAVEELGIPEGVREVVGKRLSRLSEDTNRVLRAAAVVGTEFEPTIVLRVDDRLDQERLIGGLEEAITARVVLEVTGGKYRFAHALVRDTVYRNLSAMRRAALHRRVAEAIEIVHADDLADHLPALALHWAQAATGTETVRAASYAAQAGDRALDQLAHDEAATFYEQALELLDAGGVAEEDPRRVDALIALGEAQRRAGDGRYRETLLRGAHLAKQAGDTDRLARAALANSRGFWSMIGSVDAERVAVLRSALEGSANADSATRARLLVTLAAEAVWLPEADHQRLADEALDIARRLDEPSTLAHVLRLRGFTFLSDPATLHLRWAETAELLALAVELDDPLLSCLAFGARFAPALEMGDAGEAKRCLERVDHLADELNQPLLRWFAAFETVTFSMVTGDFRSAEQALQRAAVLSRAAGEPDRQVFHGIQLAALRLQQGRLTEVGQLLTDTIAAAPAVVSLRAQLALYHIECGRSDGGLAVLGELCDELERRRDASWSRGVALTTLLCAELGDASAAARLHRLLVPYAGQFVASLVTAFGAIDLYLGMLCRVLERFEEADRRFTAAADLHSSMGAEPWLAHTQLEWALMLLRRGDPGDVGRSRELLLSAVATAHELGLAHIERRGAALLRECP